MRRVRLSTGVTLAVRESGWGVPVVLMHAWAETHRTFDLLRPLLPPGLRVVVPDLRGGGDSDKPADGYGLDDAARDVVGLLDALTLADAWLVGTSSGGYVAQEVAATAPDRVRGLALLGAPCDLRLPTARALLERIAALHPTLTREEASTLNASVPLHAAVSDDFLRAQADATATIPRAVLLAGLEGLVSATPPLERAAVPAPTLILAGADDDVLPPEQTRVLARRIPRSRLVTYPDTGHLVLWERPGPVAAELAAFLRDRS